MKAGGAMGPPSLCKWSAEQELGRIVRLRRRSFDDRPLPELTVLFRPVSKIEQLN